MIKAKFYQKRPTISNIIIISEKIIGIPYHRPSRFLRLVLDVLAIQKDHRFAEALLVEQVVQLLYDDQHCGFQIRLLGLVAIAALIIPLHHKLEHWTTQKLVEKNKAIRLANAKKTIEELENNNTK